MIALDTLQRIANERGYQLLNASINSYYSNINGKLIDSNSGSGMNFNVAMNTLKTSGNIGNYDEYNIEDLIEKEFNRIDSEIK